MEKEAVIRVENLSKSFGDLTAVQDLTFSVNKGDVYGFLGPNGAGKSTTLRMLLGLIRSDNGRIFYFGKDFEQHRNFAFRKIGSIVEKPDFYRYLSAEKNLELFGKLSGASVVKSKMEALFELVGLKGREKDPVHSYSHGMKQRLGLAQTLIHDPELILLDEPTTGLDPQGIIDIRNLIIQLQVEQQKTVLLSSHILSEIELVANRMIIINKGKVITEGEVQSLLSSDQRVVLIQFNERAACESYLRESKWVYEYMSENSGLHTYRFQLQQEDIPVLIKELTNNNINIYNVNSRRQLEDYFLKLTAKEGGSPV